MSNPRVLHELMEAVDADSANNLAPRSRTSRSRGQSATAVRQTPPPQAPSPTDASFEFSAYNSYSSASPASMVFSDGQLRAHQFPAVRSSSTESSQVMSSSMDDSANAASSTAGSKKRVSFAADGAGRKSGGAQKKKGGGLLGCMGSACGRNHVAEPAMNVNRKVVVAV